LEDESPLTWKDSIRKNAVNNRENQQDSEHLIEFMKHLCSYKQKMQKSS